MTNLELFLKYNMKSNITYDKPKDETLNYLLYSEQILPKVSTKENAWNIMLYCTYNCNLNCNYCQKILKSNYQNTQISEDTIRDIIKKLGEKIGVLSLIGGEPLLLSDDIIAACIDERNKNNFQFEINIVTNGILFHLRKDFLEENVNNVTFKFDGLFNNTNKGTESTNKMLENIMSNSNISIKNIINQLNLNEYSNAFIENYNYYKQLNLKRINISIVNNFDYDNSPTIIINKNNLNKILEYIDYWIHDTNNPIEDIFISKQILRLFQANRICWDIPHCFDGYFCIDPLGNIGHCNCNLLINNYCNINDINNYEDLLENKNYQLILSKTANLRNYNCMNCIWYDSCAAGCMGMNYEKDNDFKKIDRDYCIFTKFILSGIYQLIKNINIEKDKNLYNPYFIKILKDNKYYSLDEIFEIEEKYKEEDQS